MRRLALLSAACLIPSLAAAQPVRGLYIGADVGANFVGALQSAGDSTKVNTNPGPVGVLSLGWGFGNGLRAEIEGNYRSNSVDSIDTLRLNGQQLPLGNPNGNVASYGVMANLDYDLPVAPFGLHPYIGAGIGYTQLDFGDVSGDGDGAFHLANNNIYTGPDHVSFGSAGAFAYQVMLGAALPLHMLPNLDLTVEYRFFGTARADVPVDRVAMTTNRINGAIPSASTHDGFSLHDQTVLIGLRYTFNGL